MKYLMILLVFIAFQLSLRSEWINEPEEIKIRELKPGKVLININIYNSHDYKIRYGKKSNPSPIDFKQELTKLSKVELRMLKYELYARKGYLFDDVVIRDYFNAKKWYQPVYWLNDLNFILNSEEETFYQKIKAREDIFLKEQAKSNHFDINSISNIKQLDSLDDTFLNKLIKNGFVVVENGAIELYETYETNKYSKFPNFVTTDFYLQLMHLFFARTLTTIEEENLIPILKSILKSLYKFSTDDLKSQDKTNTAVTFSQFYFAMAYELLTGEKLKIDKSMEKDRIIYLSLTKNASQQYKSKLFDADIDFSQFKPRGNYDRTEKLKKYFKTMMWLSKMPFFTSNEISFFRAKYIAKLLDRDKKVLTKYNNFNSIIDFLIGNPDNLSIDNLRSSLSEDDKATLEKLSYYNMERIKQKGEWAEKRSEIYFLPQRFTPDSKIMIDLVLLSKDEPRREFPKALDVFAAFGNKSAEDILLNHYKVAQTWPNYVDTLDKLKIEFKDYNFNENTYGNWLLALNKLFIPNEMFPLVMRLENWNRKNLNTALASYAELKHDAILYAEQPVAAEMDGDDSPYEMPPQPKWVGYVEPNVAFWESSLNFVNQLISNLNKAGIKNKVFIENANSMLLLNKFLLEISKKELERKILSDEEYEHISNIGGEFENLKSRFNIVYENKKKENEDWSPDIINDDEMAVVADVFTNNDNCLELGVGRADDIYCLVDIGGYYYITRGSVFSFYEFEHPSSDRLTDKQWREMLGTGNEPERQSWYKEIFIKKSKVDIHEMEVNPSSFIEIKSPNENP